MMKLFTTALLLVYTVALFSQAKSFEIGINDHYFQSSSGGGFFNGKLIVGINESVQNSFATRHRLLVVNEDGEVDNQFDVVPSFSEVTYGSKIILTDEEIIDFGTLNYVCDVPTNIGLFVSGYSDLAQDWSFLKDYDGTIISSFQGASIINDHWFVNGNKSSGSKIIIGEQDSLIAEIDVQPEDLNGFVSWDLGVLTAFGSATVFQFNELGETIDSLVFNQEIEEAIASADFIYLLLESELVKMDFNLQIINTIDLTGYSNLSRLKWSNNKLRFSANNQDHLEIMDYDQDLNPLSIFSIPAVNNGWVDYNYEDVVLVNEFELTRYRSVRVQNFDLTLDEDLEIEMTDAALVGMSYDSLYANSDDPDYPVYSVGGEFNVLVKNEGEFPLTSVNVNLDQGYGICSAHFALKKFTELNVLPGEAVWLNMGFISDYNYFGDSLITLERCFFTSNPNGYVDLNVDNDVYCEEVIYGIVGNQELEACSFKLFPNPFMHELNISCLENSNSYSVKIYNMNGQLVKMTRIDDNQINLESLNDGLYYLVLESGKGISHRELILKQ